MLSRCLSANPSSGHRRLTRNGRVLELDVAAFLADLVPAIGFHFPDYRGCPYRLPTFMVCGMEQSDTPGGEAGDPEKPMFPAPWRCRHERTPEWADGKPLLWRPIGVAKRRAGQLLKMPTDRPTAARAAKAIVAAQARRRPGRLIEPHVVYLPRRHAVIAHAAAERGDQGPRLGHGEGV